MSSPRCGASHLSSTSSSSLCPSDLREASDSVPGLSSDTRVRRRGPCLSPAPPHASCSSALLFFQLCGNFSTTASEKESSEPFCPGSCWVPGADFHGLSTSETGLTPSAMPHVNRQHRRAAGPPSRAAPALLLWGAWSWSVPASSCGRCPLCGDTAKLGAVPSGCWHSGDRTGTWQG